MAVKKLGLYDRLELSLNCKCKYVLYYEDRATDLSDKIDLSAVAIFEKSINPCFQNVYVCIKNGNDMRDDIKKRIDKIVLDEWWNRK